MTTAEPAASRTTRSQPGVPNYSLIRAHPIAGKVFPPRDPSRDQPHYHLHLVTGASHFDVAVNVLSTDQSQVLFHINDQFRPPREQDLLALKAGIHAIGSAGANGLGLDFIRQHLVTRDQMQLLDVTRPVQTAANLEAVIAAAMATPLHGSIDALVQSAIQQTASEVFVFGSLFRNKGKNPFFNFSPDVGIHDIHMNQGNPTNGSFGKDNGIYKDGSLLVRLPGETIWHAVFIAFQTQSWHTDNHGNPV